MNTGTPYFTTKDQLFEWFSTNISNREPFNVSWRLYDGFLKGFTGKSPLYRLNSTELSVQDAFDKLWDRMQTLAIEPDTKFTISLPTGKKGAGNDGGKISFLANSKTSIGNMNDANGMFSISNLINDKLKIQELERKVNDLENAAPDGGVIDRIFTRLEDSGLIEGLIMGFASKKMGINLMMGESQTEEEGQVIGGNLSIQNSLQKVAHHFQSEQELLLTFDKMCTLFASNPEYFKQILNQDQNG